MTGHATRLLVTGSRHYSDAAAVESALQPYRHQHLTLVHGDAPGLDRIAADTWIGWGEKTQPVHARWMSEGNRAGPLRNQRMVDLGGYVACLAFPLPGSRGTYDCVRRAKDAGIEVIFPDTERQGP